MRNEILTYHLLLPNNKQQNCLLLLNNIKQNHLL